MASRVTALASDFASIITTAAVSMVIAGAIAWGAARTWGKTKRSRRAIFGIVGTIGVLLALLIAQLRLRAVG